MGNLPSNVRKKRELELEQIRVGSQTSRTLKKSDLSLDADGLHRVPSYLNGYLVVEKILSGN